MQVIAMGLMNVVEAGVMIVEMNGIMVVVGDVMQWTADAKNSSNRPGSCL